MFHINVSLIFRQQRTTKTVQSAMTYGITCKTVIKYHSCKR